MSITVEAQVKRPKVAAIGSLESVKWKLSSSYLESNMKEAIADVQSNKDSLFDTFNEHPDTTAFLIDAQVIPKPSPTPFPDVPNIPQGCEICCELTDKLSGLACNHKECFECWKSYLTEKIVGGKQCDIECLDSKCKLLIEDEKLMCNITDSTVVAMFEKLTINSYVFIFIYIPFSSLLGFKSMKSHGKSRWVQQW
ncbi:hypothetical protein CRE_09745 [Caenorhabditis remanei]|uniref:Uncharacterized protein n=1 Tax=Caenorhabditis remanei TaxID=31234 RepID=E3N4Z6_CAERE|nr:hypothetical protein CRE_09745 [Caenorhabditis remanei]